ncbi:hypothetical protein Gotri_012366 [Gossypium trilobum]|uniref:Phytocyanin domain-containing protein n=1 Tax=Gossypium trilobum TaxID=34281 RepID=A0A7J9DQ80_9ROSI|nr:hypothetical protein [Gossypium trilobum]
MVSPKHVMLMFTIIAPSAICFGAVYRVGDASGWHPMFNYTKWASSNKFHVGDTIRFEYNAIFHNVKEVTEPNYRACNGTKAIATYFSGNDSFTLDHPGHRYFLCGFPYHCRYGQKVEIYVVGEGSSPSPSPSPVADKNPANSASSSHHIFSVQFVTKYLAMNHIKTGDLNVHIGDFVDIIDGIVIGAILATMLSANDGTGRPIFTAGEAVKFITQNNSVLFKVNKLVEVLHCRKRFSGRSMDKVLQEIFRREDGTFLTLKATCKPLLVPFYDLKTYAPFCWIFL